jgi:phosphate:Na+ symporter
VITAAGGLALFLLGMSMMTDGLKTFAGSGLRRWLARGTATPLRGVLSGVAVTALVQSSSAVTIATIGFVNAGMLTLRQALGVVFGTNVGTTMTGWLVSLVGFGWKIDNLALPLLAVGVVLRLAAEPQRLRGLGEALAGFGLFFLALSLLQDAFAGFAAAHGTALVTTGAGLAGVAAAVGAGILVTTLTQSSSAALAIILSAASSGLVDLPAAAAAVIGANIGTTSTAALAAIRATAAARRLALGHIAFNLVTGAIALLLLPLVLAAVARLAAVLEIGSGAAPFLALFHTSFNVLGVLIMLPLAGRLAERLERWFHTEDENLARPQFLDGTLAATPALAVAAIDAELRRLGAAVGQLGRLALASATEVPAAGGEVATPDSVARQSAAARELGNAVVRYASQVQTEAMQAGVAADLTRLVRAARYLDEAARLMPRLRALRDAQRALDDGATLAVVRSVLEAAAGVVAGLGALDAQDAARATVVDLAAERFESHYALAKSGVLTAIVQRRVSVDAADELLDALSATRRLVDQLVKAERLLRGAAPGGTRGDGAGGARG